MSRLDLVCTLLEEVSHLIYIPYKMKYWRGVNFGDFIKKSPIFNPPTIMDVCHTLLHFI